MARGPDGKTPSTRKRRRAANTVALFIVQIGTHRGNESVCGAVYWNEYAAQQEVKRLNEANKNTRAYYVVRTLPVPDRAL